VRSFCERVSCREHQIVLKFVKGGNSSLRATARGVIWAWEKAQSSEGAGTVHLNF
jgi:hypothetical protein